MIGLVLSGLVCYWWERKVRKPGETNQPLFFLVALVLMLVAGVAETWIPAGLKYCGPHFTISPYRCGQLFKNGVSGLPLFLAAVIGLVLGGRLCPGRSAPR